LFGLQTLFDPMTLIILGALVLCLVLWGIFAARRKPTLVATVREEPAPVAPPEATLRPAPPPPVMPPPPVTAPPPISIPVVPQSGFGPGPHPLPPVEAPLVDSRVVTPTEVVVVWRAVSLDVEEYTVRIDTVSRDQLVFGGLARSAQAAGDARYERRLFHTMVLPNESILSLRTRAGAPINNVRAWLRELPDAV